MNIIQAGCLKVGDYVIYSSPNSTFNYGDIIKIVQIDAGVTPTIYLEVKNSWFKKSVIVQYIYLERITIHVE